MSTRTFPGHWRVEATDGGHFIVEDANSFDLAYIYARKDADLRDKHLTPYCLEPHPGPAEALSLAKAIAKLPLGK